jgi:hypothetical protein
MKKHRRRIFNREGAFEPEVRGEEGRGKHGRNCIFYPFFAFAVDFSLLSVITHINMFSIINLLVSPA